MDDILLRPLIVAVTMDASATQRLSAWRTRFFPPERNFLPAHLMMYHRLDGEAIKRVRQQLQLAAAIEGFTLNMPRLRGQGGFVGVDVEAPALLALKRSLDRAFDDLLVPQDRHGYKPHVTLVNKVTAAEGASSLAALAAEFTPFVAQAIALELHAYAGGPWELLERFAFNNPR